MADHGKNKRRSHHARKRQRIGKYKRDLHKKESAKKIKKWFVFGINRLMRFTKT